MQLALTTHQQRLGILIGVVVASFVGAMATQSLSVVVAVTLVSALTILVTLGRHVAPLFFASLGFVLSGYLLLDRGFAYLGVPPFFIGEAVLGLGIGSFLLTSKSRWRIDPIQVLLILFMLWGVVRTIPYIAEYRFDALRDSVIWLYPFFAIVIVSLLPDDYFRHAVRLFSRLIFPFLLIAPPVLIASRILSADAIPSWPLSENPVLSYKGGDLAVHLVGVAAFILLGLSHLSGRREVYGWLLWGGAAVLMITGRSAVFTLLLGLATVWILSSLLPGAARVEGRPERALSITGHKFRMLLVMGGAIAIFLIVAPEIQFGSRTISLGQLKDNVVSLVQPGSSGSRELEGSRGWRLRWWTEIVDYTFHGPFFWTGKGFGINLATADGFQATADESLRSPHSAHLTVLARMGVPGLVLWIGILVGFALTMLQAFFRAIRTRQLFWAQLNAWILTYWLAFVVNASFDVYLEGPQGGIWFWSLFGFGLAALREQRLAHRESALGIADRRAHLPYAHSSDP